MKLRSPGAILLISCYELGRLDNRGLWQLEPLEALEDLQLASCRRITESSLFWALDMAT